jgi:hypothetical protein
VSPRRRLLIEALFFASSVTIALGIYDLYADGKAMELGRTVLRFGLYLVIYLTIFGLSLRLGNREDA